MEHFEKCVKDGDNFGNLQFFCFVFFSIVLNLMSWNVQRSHVVSENSRPAEIVSWNAHWKPEPSAASAQRLHFGIGARYFHRPCPGQGNRGIPQRPGRGGAGVGGGTFLGSISVDATGRITGTLLLLESPAGHVPMRFGSHRGSPLCAHHTEGHGSLTRCHGARSKVMAPRARVE